MHRDVALVVDAAEPYRLVLGLRGAREDLRLFGIRALRRDVARFPAAEALPVLGQDLRLSALLRGVSLLEAVGARDISLVARRRRAPRWSASWPIAPILLDLPPNERAELLVRHAVRAVEVQLRQDVRRLRAVTVERIGSGASRAANVRFGEPLRAVANPLAEHCWVAVELVELPERLVADLHGNQAHDGADLPGLRQARAASLEVGAVGCVPRHERLVNVPDLRHARRGEDRILEGEQLRLRLLGHLEVHDAPYLQAVLHVDTVEEIPGGVHQVDVQEAPEVVREHLWIVAQHCQRIHLVHGVDQHGSRDRLCLQLRPAKEILHVGVLRVQIVGDLLAPQLGLHLPVVARQLVLRGLGIEGRLRRLEQLAVLVLSVVAEDVMRCR